MHVMWDDIICVMIACTRVCVKRISRLVGSSTSIAVNSDRVISDSRFSIVPSMVSSYRLCLKICGKKVKKA